MISYEYESYSNINDIIDDHFDYLLSVIVISTNLHQLTNTSSWLKFYTAEIQLNYGR